MKQLIKNMEDAKSAIGGNNSRRKQIIGRIEEVEDSIEALNKQITAAEESKAEALKKFALGTAVEADVEKARTAIKNLNERIEEKKELVVALNNELETTIDCNLIRNPLEVAVNTAERALWTAIAEQELAKAKQAVTPIILKAFYAAMKRQEDGTSMTMLEFRDFVGRFFDSAFANAAREESKKYEGEILKRYL